MKIVIIINGSGGVGKDTICSIVSKHYLTLIYSTIDDVKRAAVHIGWKGGKELNDRAFLSDLKDLSSKYYDFPFKQAVKMYEYFMHMHYHVLFFHVREPQEIEKLKNHIKNDELAIVKTLLIKRNVHVGEYGNHADDDVEQYEYELVFENNGPLEKLESEFMEFWRKNIENDGRKERVKTNM